MFALRVRTPLVPGLPNTRMVSTPLLFTDTDPKRALAGGLGGAGGAAGTGAGGTGFANASAASIAPTASTAPPVTVTPAIPNTGLAPFLMACTTWAAGAPGSTALTSAATPATCGAAIEVPAMAV